MEGAIDKAIVTLNSIHVGEMERITRRLDEVRKTLLELDEPELITSLDEARQAIESGQLPRFRKRIQHVVSRLGHLR